MNELEQARLDRDNAFGDFVLHSGKSQKHQLKAQAARAKYVLARDTVRALERDIMCYPALV